MNVKAGEYMEILQAIGDIEPSGLLIPNPRGLRHKDIRRNSPLLRYQAQATFAWVFFRYYIRHKHGGSLYLAESFTDSSLKRAIRHANALARHNFVPSISLHILAYLHALKTLHNFDARNDILYKVFRHAWAAYDEFRTSQSLAEATRRQKIRGQEHRYRCAARKCGIQATHANALRRCAGNCPESVKPYYCSYACQRNVRARCGFHAPYAHHGLFRTGASIDKFVHKEQPMVP